MQNNQKINWTYLVVSLLGSGLMSIMVAVIVDRLSRKRDEADKQELRQELRAYHN